MTENDFLLEAGNIPDDPLMRIPEKLKNLVTSGKISCNCHCHLFNEQTVPKALFNLKMPGGPLFHMISMTIAKILHRLNSRSNDDWGSRVAYFIETFLKPARAIADKLLDYYPDHANTLFTPLMMDMHNRAERRIRKPAEFYITKQADDLSELINDESGRYNLLPFIPVDPTISPDDRNAFDHFDIFLKAFRGEYGFMPGGIKIYPSLGYLPSHPLLMPVYEVCERKNIPVTAHCSSGTVHAYFRRIKNIRGWKIGADGNLTDRPETKWFLFFQKNKYENYFNHPKNWEPVLQQFPNLRINFAHFGGSRQWRRLIRGRKNTWPTRIIDYFGRFPNVYADVSYTNAFPEINKLIKERIVSSALVRSRVLYGFDYYMVVKEGHYRSIKAEFDTLMGEAVIDEISRVNPLKFLF